MQPNSVRKIHGQRNRLVLSPIPDIQSQLLLNIPLRMQLFAQLPSARPRLHPRVKITSFMRLTYSLSLLVDLRSSHSFSRGSTPIIWKLCFVCSPGCGDPTNGVLLKGLIVRLNPTFGWSLNLCMVDQWMHATPSAGCAPSATTY